MMALFWLVDRLLSLYMWAVILAAVFSVLTSFGMLDTRNRLVWTIGDFLYRITEPALRPIRNLLPNLGGIDISPIILILLLQAARMLLGEIEISVMRSVVLSRFLAHLPDGVAVAVKVQPKSRRPGLHGRPIGRRRTPAHRRYRGGGGWPCQPRRLCRAGRRAGPRAVRGASSALGATSREKTLRVTGDAAALGAKLAAL